MIDDAIAAVNATEVPAVKSQIARLREREQLAATERPHVDPLESHAPPVVSLDADVAAARYVVGRWIAAVAGAMRDAGDDEEAEAFAEIPDEERATWIDADGLGASLDARLPRLGVASDG